MRALRWPTALCCLLLVTLSAGASEADLLEAAATAREQAEAALAEERSRILTARAERTAQVTELTRTLAQARARIATVEAESARMRPEIERLRQTGAGVESQLVQQITRVAALLHIGTLPRGLSERATAVALALAAAPEGLADQSQVRVAEEQVQDRTGTAVQVPVLRIGVARAVAYGGTAAARGVLVERNGLLLVSGPPLPPAAEGAVGDPTRVVLDVSGTWGAQTPPPRRSFLEWLRGGRIFIWPILGVGLLGAAIAISRTWILTRFRPTREPLDAVLAWLRGDRSQPLPTATARPIDRVLAVGVASLPQSRAAREAALDQAVLAEAPGLQRGLSILLLLASIAPLLGLLGTVTGMIDLFAVIGAQGSGNARSLSGGISEALITTQAGMLVAVPLLVAHALLNRASERHLLLLEECASGVLGHEEPSR